VIFTAVPGPRGLTAFSGVAVLVEEGWEVSVAKGDDVGWGVNVLVGSTVGKMVALGSGVFDGTGWVGGTLVGGCVGACELHPARMNIPIRKSTVDQWEFNFTVIHLYYWKLSWFVLMMALSLDHRHLNRGSEM